MIKIPQHRIRRIKRKLVLPKLFDREDPKVKRRNKILFLIAAYAILALGILLFMIRPVFN